LNPSAPGRQLIVKISKVDFRGRLRIR
jgi:hypothetical protein